MHLLISELHHRRQGQWLAKLREGNSKNTQTWTPICAAVVIGTSGVFGKQTISFLQDLACCVCKVSVEVRSFLHLLQPLQVAIWQGNVVSVLGTFASEDCLVLIIVTHSN